MMNSLVSRIVDGQVLMWLSENERNDAVVWVECKGKHGLYRELNAMSIASFQDKNEAFRWVNGFMDGEIREIHKLMFEMWDMEPSIKRLPISNKIEKIKKNVDKRIGLKET